MCSVYYETIYIYQMNIVSLLILNGCLVNTIRLPNVTLLLAASRTEDKNNLTVTERVLFSGL